MPFIENFKTSQGRIVVLSGKDKATGEPYERQGYIFNTPIGYRVKYGEKSVMVNGQKGWALYSHARSVLIKMMKGV